ncbi:MAG TPA: hypothetical protein VMD77_13190 [Candidatus Baltobacteraceae bacterium]|nr:hypothetical protein [Candidatus Baltobacteraceae bacterium]
MDVSTTQGLASAVAQGNAPGVHADATQSTHGSAGMAKLQKAAQDFESIMINSLWGSMNDGSLDSDDDLSDPTSSSIEQMGMQMVSGALAKAGGFGIGKMIAQALRSKV